jgi:hypothetical protein
MFCPGAVIACRCVSSTDEFLCGSSSSCVDVGYVLLACSYIIPFSPRLPCIWEKGLCPLWVVMKLISSRRPSRARHTLRRQRYRGKRYVLFDVKGNGKAILVTGREDP